MKPHCILIVALLPALHAMPASAQPPTDAAPPSKSFFSSVLKAMLEPFYALQDGKDPLKDPEYREAMRIQWRSSLEAKYAFLVRKLKLSPTVTDQLYDLLVRQSFETLEAPNQSVGSPEYQALIRRQDRDVADLIGEHGLAQLREYDESFEYRNEITRLQVGFAGGSDLLREEQVDALMIILRDADRQLERDRPSGADFTHASLEKWQQLQAKTRDLIQRRDQRIRGLAAAVLTPAQFAALDARIRRERGHEELLWIARQIVPAGESGVARGAPGSSGPFLVGVNDDRLLKDPEYRRAWQRQSRLEVESTYIDAPRLLDLTSGLTEQFYSLLVDQQLVRLENPTRTSRSWNDTLRREERELAALLGERGFAQFRGLRDTYGIRFQVKHLQVENGAGPDSMQVHQVEALIAVLHNANQESWSDAHIRESAAAFLTPPQLAALAGWLQRNPR
jgi:hypothetical protein